MWLDVKFLENYLIRFKDWEKMMTISQLSMSRPSSSTEVATRTLDRPELKSSRASCCPPGLSQSMPCQPPLPTTRFGRKFGYFCFRCLCRTSAESLVWTKIRIRFCPASGDRYTWSKCFSRAESLGEISSAFRETGKDFFNLMTLYSGDLNTGLVWYSKNQK